MRRLHRVVLLVGLVAVAPVLAGCEDFDADKFDVFGINQKKKLPGERKELFPEGVPGVTQGIPPEYLKEQPTAAGDRANSGRRTRQQRCARAGEQDGCYRSGRRAEAETQAQAETAHGGASSSWSDHHSANGQGSKRRPAGAAGALARFEPTARATEPAACIRTELQHGSLAVSAAARHLLALSLQSG